MIVKTLLLAWLLLLSSPVWPLTAVSEPPGYFFSSGKDEIAGQFGIRPVLKRGVISYRCGSGTVSQTFPGSSQARPMSGPVQGQATRFEPNGKAVRVQTFSTATYHNLYPGISLRFMATAKGLKTEYEVAPGADPSRIRVRYQGGAVKRMPDGDLEISCSGDSRIIEHSLIAFELGPDGSRREVAVDYRILPNNTVSFSIGPYDTSRSLIIDPYLLNHTANLGSPRVDVVAAMVTDDAGNIYGTGYSESPLLGAPVNMPFRGGVDAFVFKLEAGSRRLLYTTYIGGASDDRAASIALDATGNIYVAGYTQSVDFLGSHSVAGPRDAFVVALNPAGNSIRFSKILRGSGADEATAIAVSPAGGVWVTGHTDSTDFAVQQPFQAVRAGGKDCFLIRLSTDGTVQYSSYFGGAGDDQATGMAIDTTGSVFITGGTTSINLPTRAAIQANNRGGQDAFAARFSSTGADLVYSTYLGGQLGSGPAPETGLAVAVDSLGNAYVTGSTPSRDFPLTLPYQAGFGGGTTDAFLVRISPSGMIVSSTYFGGASTDAALGLAVMHNGNVWVAGYTGSTDLRLIEPVQAAHGGTLDGFVAAFDAELRAPVFASFFGGREPDSLTGVRQLPDYTIVVCGTTASPDVPSITLTGTIDPYVLTFRPEMPIATYVSSLYSDVLVRQPDPAGFNNWVNLITSGRLTRAQVAEAFIRSEEAVIRSIYIIKLYLGVLLRDPDYAGWRGWTSALLSSGSRSLIVAGFLQSPEFKARYGSLTDDAFVRQLYRNILGRDPDPAGLEGWKAVLARGVSRNDVAVGFLDSIEFDLRTRARAETNLFYMSFLRRAGDPAGLDNWQNVLATHTLAEAVQGIINSPEYLGRIQ